MSDEHKDPQPGNATSQTAMWIVTGIGIGTALGVAFNNIPIGIAIGVAIGAAIGFGQMQGKKKE